MKVSSDITYRVSRSWWSRSILCNPQPRKSRKNKSNPSSIDVSFGLNRVLYDSLHQLPDLFFNFIAALGRPSRSITAGVIIIGRNGVGKSTLLRHIAMRDVLIPAYVSILFVEQEVRYIFPLFYFHVLSRRTCKLLTMIPQHSALFSRPTCGETTCSVKKCVLKRVLRI